MVAVLLLDMLDILHGMGGVKLLEMGIFLLLHRCVVCEVFSC